MQEWKLLLLLLTLPPAVFATTTADAEASESEEEGEGDSAPFVVAIEHSNGWRCSGSLVSTRAVLTSAWCALGPPTALLPAPTSPSSEAPLWAMAGSRPRGPHAIRRVTAISLAFEARAEEAGASTNHDRWSSWGGAENDIALLELTTAFGSAANVRPILLAAAEKDCGAATCHSVQGAGRGVLVIETLTRASASCAPLAPHWQTVREKALCFKGPELCPNEWGSGVICDGKLCGVISRSARDDSLNDSAEIINEKLVSGCGSVHAALSVPRWRKFFDCAHALRKCGKDKCAKICTEKRLEETQDQPPTETAVVEEIKIEDHQEDEKRRDDTKQEDSGENAIVPAAARNEPAIHYDPPDTGGVYGNAYHPEYTRYQPLRTGYPQDVRRQGQRPEQVYDRDLNVRDYSVRPEYGPKPDYPARNFNYPREDLVRGHDVRNWTTYEFDRTKPTNYDRELISTHVPFIDQPRGMEYEDAQVPYQVPVQPVPSNVVGTSPPFVSSAPNVYPPPFAAPPTYAVQQIVNPQPQYAAAPNQAAVQQESRAPPPPAAAPAAPPVAAITVSRQREFEPYRSDFKVHRHFPTPVTVQSQPPVPPPFEPVDAAATRPATTVLFESLLIIYTLTI